VWLLWLRAVRGIQEYADNWGKLTNEQSLSFIRRWLDADIAIAQLRQKVRANRVSDFGWKEVSNFFSIGPTHCDDD